MDKDVVVHIFNGILLSHTKERICISPSELDEARASYTEWKKSEREKQVSYINTYMWNLEKWYWWTNFKGKNTISNMDNRIMGSAGEERVEWIERVTLKYSDYDV